MHIGEVVFGNRTALRVLLYLERYGQAYPTQIARGFMIPVNMVQKQLQRLEEGGLLMSRRQGKHRIFTWNAHFSSVPLLREFLVRFDAMGPTDAGDGSNLPVEDRLAAAESLWKEAAALGPKEKVQPLRLTKFFDRFEDYHAWEKTRRAA